ncbi:MAG: hypothetical protein IT429_16495 [Gemmataceae bacterium]|nr:hypothetical protein [Gemmataceae bacterium]
MDGQGGTDILPMHDEEGPDSLYEKITSQGLQELEAQRHAEEERRRVSTPPPDTRTPEQKAAKLQEFASSVFLFGADGPFFRMRDDVQPFKLYLDHFLKEAGVSGDPLERLLLEQVLLGHHAVGRLHFRAGTSQNMEGVTACLAAVARLMAECRRTTLALQAYRGASEAGKARSSKKPRRPATPTATNGHGNNGATTSPDSELASNEPQNRLNGYLNGTCHAQPVLS